jgi:hypothetical protein
MNATDDIALAERAGLSLGLVPGEEMNLKLTTREDFVLAERLASASLATFAPGPASMCIALRRRSCLAVRHQSAARIRTREDTPTPIAVCTR